MTDKATTKVEGAMTDEATVRVGGLEIEWRCDNPAGLIAGKLADVMLKFAKNVDNFLKAYAALLGELNDLKVDKAAYASSLPKVDRKALRKYWESTYNRTKNNKRIPVTPWDKIEEIISMYESGADLDAMVAKTGVKIETARNWLARAGVRKVDGKFTLITPKIIKGIVKMMKGGVETREITRFYKMHTRSVKAIIRRELPWN